MLKFIIGPVCMSNLVLMWIVKNEGKTYVLNFLKFIHFSLILSFLFSIFPSKGFSYKEIASNSISFTIFFFISQATFLYCMWFSKCIVMQCDFLNWIHFSHDFALFRSLALLDKRTFFGLLSGTISNI